MQAGRPKSGVIAGIMCLTRKKYHLAAEQMLLLSYKTDLHTQNQFCNSVIANSLHTLSSDF